MKVEEIIENVNEKKGTYAGLKFSKETGAALKKYIGDNDIPNPIESDKLHSTLLYSRKHLPEYKALGELDKAWEGRAEQFSIFKSNPKNGGTGSNCLVLEYVCKPQVARWDTLMDEHDATYDFDEYKPHITLSYDVGDLEYEKLPKFEDDIQIVEEYGEDLDLDWTGK